MGEEAVNEKKDKLEGEWEVKKLIWGIIMNFRLRLRLRLPRRKTGPRRIVGKSGRGLENLL